MATKDVYTTAIILKIIIKGAKNSDASGSIPKENLIKP